MRMSQQTNVNWFEKKGVVRKKNREKGKKAQRESLELLALGCTSRQDSRHELSSASGRSCQDVLLSRSTMDKKCFQVRVTLLTT